MILHFTFLKLYHHVIFFLFLELNQKNIAKMDITAHVELIEDFPEMRFK